MTRMSCTERNIRKLASNLGLTEDQQDQLRAVFRAHVVSHGAEMRARREQRREKIEAAMEAFKSDSFDAARLGLFDHPRGLAARKVQHLARLADKLLPVLSSEQRGKLAGQLEQKARQIKQAPRK